MKLAIDEAIWGVPSLFTPLGDVSTIVGRFVSPQDVRNADALIVRSVTRVNKLLLAGSRVQFVGTAGSGTDHVDLDYLAARGIAFADAAGCNSRTVAEYVLAALLLLAGRGGFDLAGMVLGVVGVGRIGSIVAAWGRSLGMYVLLCDPPLGRAGIGGPYVSAVRLAAESDVISLHVPLVRDGPDATLGMVNDAWLSRIKKGAILINTSRGEAACEDALLEAVARDRLGPIVIDVWNNEPNINPKLVKAAAIATPHIAGYSVEARQRAAVMVRDRLAEFQRVRFGGGGSDVSMLGDSDDVGPVVDASLDSIDEPWEAMTRIVLSATGIVEADRALRGWIDRPGTAVGFDELRFACSARREFPAHSVRQDSFDDRCGNLLSGWGFHLK